jgi:hypothetical protein
MHPTAALLIAAGHQSRLEHQLGFHTTANQGTWFILILLVAVLAMAGKKALS